MNNGLSTTATHYCYDAFGRRVAKSSEVQKASKINQRGKLVRFPDSLLHLRVDEKANRQTMLMLWDGNRQIQEYTTDHVFTTVYEQNSFVPVARIVERQPHLLEKAKIHEQAEWGKYGNTVLTERTKANIYHKVHTGLRIYHYHTDHLGTPQELTNDRGDVVWLNYSLAWGGSFDRLNHVDNLDGLNVSADELQPIRFQGQFFDIETNLHYNRFRYYDSDVGMFVSRDPIGLIGGNNVFQYAPNPIGWSDPWGLAKVPSIHRDSLGRITEWKFKVNHSDIGTGTPTTEATRKYARSLGGKCDDAGHAQGSNLGGSGSDKDNIFPQSINSNRGKMRDFELLIAAYLDTHPSTFADATVTAVYRGASTRPAKIKYFVEFSDGKTLKATIANPKSKCP